MPAAGTTPDASDDRDAPDAPGTPDDRAGATEEDHRLAAELATRTGVLLIELRREYGFDVSDEAGGPGRSGTGRGGADRGGTSRSRTGPGSAGPGGADRGGTSRSRTGPGSAGPGGAGRGGAGPGIADMLRAGGDRLAHEFLAAALAEARPDDAVLSEEAPDDRRRLGHRRVWIIDPLDGTRQYGEPGRTDWGVHVALAIDGAPVAGAVALPAEGVTLSTADPPSLPPSPSGSSDGSRRRVIASRSRPGSDARVVAAALDAELIALGSVGAKVAQVIRGGADAYVHSGGQSEWDSAAPVAVALACGLHASRIDGRALRYNRPNVELPDLLVCRTDVAEAALAALAAPAATTAG